ncbi:2b2914d1-e173-433b-bb84-b9cd0c470f3c-CDS [Sclerotinia trifoliorum]|uniref:2b2914d1-e173-433b-bb84-b9cd0c470f3c-CDS n=1 Tax=Sclerotinia trifoliorum TaxID=28548 RepID=A0A8H2VUZ4_9HELO|nr:2b2914d1-e173-433b-bb84-b9cd0c470f3c-CDS [Sclerotinia trifoliorum]
MSLPYSSDGDSTMASSLTRLAFYTSNLQSFLSSSSTFRILRSLSPPISIPSTSPTPKNLTSITFNTYDPYRGPLYSTSNNTNKDEPLNDSNQNHSESSSPQTLYILDSSFNPPTLAHAHICLSALHDHYTSDLRHTKARLLLLLSTQNADKKISGASLEERLVGMECFATDLLSTWLYPRSSYQTKRQVKSEIDGKSTNVSEERNESGDEESAKDIESDSTSDSDSEAQSTTSSFPSSQTQIPFNSPQFDIDIALTSLPYFHSKSAAIEASSIYPKGTTHIHCTGYDTLIRVLNPKYYPPTHDLSPLIPFLSNHKLRVTYRSENSLTLSDQDTYLSSLPTQLPTLGGKSEWISEKRIYMSSGLEGEEISSTRVRATIKSLSSAIPQQKAVGSKKSKGKGKTPEKKVKEKLKGFVGVNVNKWILGEKLFWWEGKKE